MSQPNPLHKVTTSFPDINPKYIHPEDSHNNPSTQNTYQIQNPRFTTRKPHKTQKMKKKTSTIDASRKSIFKRLQINLPEDGRPIRIQDLLARPELYNADQYVPKEREAIKRGLKKLLQSGQEYFEPPQPKHLGPLLNFEYPADSHRPLVTRFPRLQIEEYANKLEPEDVVENSYLNIIWENPLTSLGVVSVLVSMLAFFGYKLYQTQVKKNAKKNQKPASRSNRKTR